MTVLSLRFSQLTQLDTFWLYCFDAEGNDIEFLFGTRGGKIKVQMAISIRAKVAAHYLPFKIEIRHQSETKNRTIRLLFFLAEI